MTENAKTPKAPKKRAPTLYFIVAIKLIKGVALLLLALGVFSLANKDLSDVFDQFLRWVHLDPERNFFHEHRRLAGHHHARPTCACWRRARFSADCFCSSKALGLAFRAKWAIWLAIGESAFFIPIEIFELVHRRPELTGQTRPMFAHPKIGLAIVLALNVLIVWYLFKNRERLFRHHQ